MYYRSARVRNAHRAVRMRQFAVVVGMVCAASVPAWATHFRSGHITWKPVASPANTVEFTVQNSWRQDGFTNGDYECVNPNSFVNQSTPMPFISCTGPGGNPGVNDVFLELIGSTRFDFGDGSTTVGSPGNRPLMYKVTSADPTNNWLFGEALDPFSLPAVDTTIQHTYSSAGTRTAKIDASARISPCTAPNAHMNNPDGNYRVQAVVDVGTGNSSPVSSLPPIVLCPQNGICTFSIPASDNEGNALNFRLATSAESGLTTQPGSPQCPNALTVSPTGVVTWNTTGCRLAGNPLPQPPNGGCNNSALNTLYSTQIVIEEVGRGTRVALDFFIQLVNPCLLPNAMPNFMQPPTPCGATLSGGPGTPLSFPVQASDPDVGNTVTLNGVGFPTGATMTPGLPTSANPVSSTFAWTPTMAQIGQHVLTFTATDQCSAQRLCSVTIDVSQENCNDGVDNDGDGRIDCADQDCAGVACNDGQFCTVGETCQSGSGICGGGTPRDCSDPNACTADSCDESTDQCVHDPTPLNGALCEDGAFCTVGDTCQAGVCLPGSARDCSDPNACTADTCNEATDQCDHDPTPLNGTGCDDGAFCTINDTCLDGVCSGSVRDCDDNNPCTADSCNESTDQCVNNPTPLNGDPCDDGAFCTVNDTCHGGACGGSTRDCDDDNACTADSCNEGTDHCDNDPAPLNGTGCNDGAFCTINDICQGGTCTGSARNCADTNDCTADSCNEGTNQCDHDPAALNGSSCDDGDFCSVNDTCQSGTCSGSPRDCTDNNVCTADSCNENTNQCVHNPNPLNDTACDDGAFCTTDDTCDNGVCSGAPRDCGDGNACTLDSCNEATDRCVNDAAPLNGSACDDGLFCTINDTCQSGVCTSGGPRNCADSSPCTADSCNEGTDRCVNDPVPLNGTACNDGTACTQNDHCMAGTCTGTPLVCNDGDACNGVETCNPARGCVPGIPLVCNDNNVCNGIEACNPASGCVLGTPLDCNDGTDCSVDRCDPVNGCSHSRMPAEGCLQPGKSLFLLRDKSDDRRDKMVWKWGKGATTSLDLGNPKVGGTSYTLCIYDQADGAGNGTLRSSITIPPGGVCADFEQCWKQVGAPPKKFRYKNKTPTFKKLLLKTSTSRGIGGLEDNARIVFRVRGEEAPLPPTGVSTMLNQSSYVLVQLVNTAGQCWEAKYLAPAIRSSLDSFKDKCLKNGQGVCE